MNLHTAWSSLSRASVSPLQLLTAGFSGLVDTPSQMWEGEQESGQAAPSKLELPGEKSFLTEFARRQSQGGPPDLWEGEGQARKRSGSPAEPQLARRAPSSSQRGSLAARDRDRGTAAAEPPSSVCVRAGSPGRGVGNQRPGWVKDQSSVATRVGAGGA